MTAIASSSVLVVGAGPMGGTTALALARSGVRVHMVSRHRWIASTPRAHITNQRAMEAFRDLGIARRIEELASPWELMGDTLFTTSLAGPEIARIRAWGSGDSEHGRYVRASPEPMLDVPQPRLESVVVAAALEAGATVSFGVEYLGHEQDGDGVTTRLRDRYTGVETAWRSDFLVGADGARSKIVEDLDLPMAGTMGRASTAYVQFRTDLSQYAAHRPSILYWIFNSESSFGEIGMGLLRAVRPWTDWIAGWGFDPDLGDPDFSEPALRERIRGLVGDPRLQPEIVATSTWQVNDAHATVLGRGRVFCGGDAIHRHPPSGGLGSNTSVQDAYNLAWKLAFVLDGRAGLELLNTYTEERAPVAAQIVARANESRRSFAAIRASIAAFGGGPEAAEALSTDPTAPATAARTSLAQAMALKHHEFNAHGVELNQEYRSTAVIDAPPATAADELVARRVCEAGAKLPHAWLVNSDGRRRSTLDLVGGGRFTVLTGVAGRAWAAAVDDLDPAVVRCVVIGTPEAQDLYFEWAALRPGPEDAAVLVRPDGYVAWVTDAPADVQGARRALGDALTRILNGAVG
jgi:2,4-dichlorophenol 6-monooxygenase